MADSRFDSKRSGASTKVQVTRRSALKAAAGFVAVPLIGVSKSRAADNVVRFGGSLGMSGRYGETGLNIKVGYEAAVKYLNEVAGGVEIGGKRYKFELGIVDDASDPSRATTLIQRQIDNGVDFFLGSYGSNVVLPCAGITERAGKITVQIGGIADQIFTQGFKNIYGFFPRATRGWDTTAAFLKQLTPQPKKVVVLGTNDAFSKSSAEGAVKICREAGFEVLDPIQLPETVNDVSSALATIRSQMPDVVITATTDQNSLVIARQMISTNTNVKLLYQLLGPQLPQYRESLAAKGTGVVGQLFWDERLKYSDPYFGDSQKYVEFYKANYTRPMAYHTAGSSACIVTYVRAMQVAGSLDPQKVRDALAATNMETVYGRVKFEPEGDGDRILMGPKIGQIQAGVFEIISPAETKTANAIYPVPKWSDKS